MENNQHELLKMYQIFNKYDFSENIESDLFDYLIEALTLFETDCIKSHQNYVIGLLVFMMKDQKHRKNIKNIFIEIVTEYAKMKDNQEIEHNMYNAMNLVHINIITQKMCELYDTTKDKKIFFDTLNFICNRF